MIPTGLYREPDVTRETEKAVCVRVQRKHGLRFNQDNQHAEQYAPVWLPKSQIEFRSDVYGDQLFVPAWLARKL